MSRSENNRESTTEMLAVQEAEVIVSDTQTSVHDIGDPRKQLNRHDIDYSEMLLEDIDAWAG